MNFKPGKAVAQIANALNNKQKDVARAMPGSKGGEAEGNGQSCMVHRLLLHDETG